MALFHDAWLFDPQAFASMTCEYVRQALQVSEEWPLNLRMEAISALDASEAGWFFPERYGGWDKDSLLRELPEHPPVNVEDISLCLTLLLYVHLSQINSIERPIGLGSLWINNDNVLNMVGSALPRRQMILTGRSFKDFYGLYLPEYSTVSRQALRIHRIGDHLRPCSTGGSAGWLSFNDVLKGFCKHEEEKAANTSENLSVNELSLFKRLGEMLSVPLEKEYGLCLILSG